VVKSIRHPGIVVSDLERSMRFYCDLLGFKVVRKMEESGPHMDRMLGLNDVRVTTVKMIVDEGGAMLELLAFLSPLPCEGMARNIHTIGLSHIAFVVENVDELYRRLSDAGVAFLSSPQLSPDGFSKVAFCRDPDGIFVELIERGLTP
jgi:catechol 2,3-dioxygenase-like lactoylglutathione lyase family enzyme